MERMNNSFLPTPDFSFQTTKVACPHCNHYIMLPKPCCESDIIDKQEKYIKQQHAYFDTLVNELQSMFPDTPIKEYFEMRRQSLKECIMLLTKRLNGDFTEIDEIKLKQNTWFQSANLPK
jgi:hypothetical protein